ncbi:hypothetical protein EMCG_01824 [[Emmonsia] crescens]|uniref:Uncharacterized protein n=1 Tax=[Emmonsia] crescens TaxID=73230 RepID=A0A0G2J9F1_9EURO|nr:hypothetical protein EMCG_01824 [Emmonsia crescens UAMH 3008]
MAPRNLNPFSGMNRDEIIKNLPVNMSIRDTTSVVLHCSQRQRRDGAYQEYHLTFHNNESQTASMPDDGIELSDESGYGPIAPSTRQNHRSNYQTIENRPKKRPAPMNSSNNTDLTVISHSEERPSKGPALKPAAFQPNPPSSSRPISEEECSPLTRPNLGMHYCRADETATQPHEYETQELEGHSDEVDRDLNQSSGVWDAIDDQDSTVSHDEVEFLADQSKTHTPQISRSSIKHPSSNQPEHRDNRTSFTPRWPRRKANHRILNQTPTLRNRPFTSYPNRRSPSLESTDVSTFSSFTESDSVKLVNENRSFADLDRLARQYYICHLDRNVADVVVSKVISHVPHFAAAFVDARRKVLNLFKTWKNLTLKNAAVWFNNWVKIESNAEFRNVTCMVTLQGILNQRFQLHMVSAVFHFADEVIDFIKCTKQGKNWLKYAFVQLVTCARLHQMREDDKTVPELAEYDRGWLLKFYDNLHQKKEFQGVSVKDFPLRTDRLSRRPSSRRYQDINDDPTADLGENFNQEL